MALIRIAGHYINNPNHIDKLIAIKGLPEEWIFRPSRFGGKELVPPWQPDVEANIPESVRHLCEPVEVTMSFPPIEKGRESVVDKKTIIGLKFDFMTEPGQELWEKITRYLERMTPRDQRIPEPVLVAPNQRSHFDPHVGRRSVRGSLELHKAEIPVVDLRQAAVVESLSPKVTATVAAPLIVTEKPTFSCDQCTKVFEKERALKMHKMSGHRKKEPAGV